MTTLKANFVMSFSSRSPGLPGKGFSLRRSHAAGRMLACTAQPRSLLPVVAFIRARSLFARLSQKLRRVFRAPVP
jgi:hypothetical protein